MLTLPPIFIAKIQAYLKDESEFFFNSLAESPATSVRVNPLKKADIFLNAEVVPWCADGYYLPERPSFIADPLFHAGAYYVQESSSMFLHHIYSSIRKLMPETILAVDVCAAPGGKSTLLSSLLSDEDALLSNEIIRSRVLTLYDNLNKWGRPNTFVSNNDPADLGNLGPFFDFMLVDAPCSGEGMFRKDKSAINEWSEAHVNLCASRQRRILEDVLPALKPGGMLVYATCTFNTQENEENINWLIQNHGFLPVHIPIPVSWPIERTLHGGFRFWPHHVKGEGLFIICLQKPVNPVSQIVFKSKKNMATVKQTALLSSFLQNSQSFDYVALGNQFHAIPSSLMPFYQHLLSSLKLIKAGITLGEIKKDELIPSHELALSVHLSANIPFINLNEEQAIIYLKKEALHPDVASGKGWHVVRYGGLALGWVKTLPNRVNNYLPAALRIIKKL